MALSLSSIINFDAAADSLIAWRRVAAAVLGLVVLPASLWLAAVELDGWRLGVTRSAASIAAAQMASPQLIYFGVQTRTFPMKIDIVSKLRPEILAAGNSRVSQFRAEMFKPYTFYNISNIIQTWEQQNRAFDALPADYRPRVMIFTLDFFMFSKDAEPTWEDGNVNPHEDMTLRTHLIDLRSFFTAISERPWLLFMPARDRIHGRPALGVLPIVDGSGFRIDGSQNYGLYFRKPYSRANPQSLVDDTKIGGVPLFLDSAPDPAQIKKFEAFVAKVRARGIQPIGVTSPFFAGVIKKMSASSELGLWRTFESDAMRRYFEGLGIWYFDFEQLMPYAADRRYFVDPIHPTETLVAAEVVALARDPRVRAILPELRADQLEQRIEARRGNESQFDFFDDSK